MTLQPGLLLVALGIFAVTGGAAAAPRVEPCSPIDSVAVAHTEAYFDDLLTSQQSSQTSLRRSLDLSQMAQFATHYVIDSTTCQSARRAVAFHLPEPYPQSRLWIYDLGPNGYAVEAPDLAPPGRPRPIFLFDRHWRYESTLEL